MSCLPRVHNTRLISPKMWTVFALFAYTVLVMTRANSLPLNDIQEVDPNGYIVYCPCMGRFGNQAEYFLGTFEFAKRLNKTLLLPAFNEYEYLSPATQAPFDTYFRVATLRGYHKVMTMEHFMESLADELWPVGSRIVFCYSDRGSKTDCNAKSGSPFGPFWDNYEIDFDGAAIYGALPLSTRPSSTDPKLAGKNDRIWSQEFPASKYPVYAFVGAPTRYPTPFNTWHIHEFMEFSDNLMGQAQEFMKAKLNGPFVGVHLRVGSDWHRACDRFKDLKTNLFSSQQCLGAKNEYGELTPELCVPSETDYLKQISALLKEYGIRKVFIAADDRQTLPMKYLLGKLDAVMLDHENAMVELVVLSESTVFIGNCLSSFTGFAYRHRLHRNKPTRFWNHDTGGYNYHEDL